MAPREKKITPQTFLLICIILGFCLTFLIYIFSEDRYWEAYAESGTRALRQRNYEWAEKMYAKALKYALEKDPDDPRVAKSFLLLHRLYKMQGRDELADQMLARARELRDEEDD